MMARLSPADCGAVAAVIALSTRIWYLRATLLQQPIWLLRSARLSPHCASAREWPDAVRLLNSARSACRLTRPSPAGARRSRSTPVPSATHPGVALRPDAAQADAPC